MFNIISGVVKAYSGEDAGHITAFLFPGDLFGLSQEGTYTNSVQAVTPVTAYQLPLSVLRSRLTKDAILEYHLICKLCQDLRYSQRHAFLVAQRHANSKIATFLQMLEQLQVARSEDTSEVHIPMERSDIGEYVGMSLAAVSRSFASLASHGIIKSSDRHHLRLSIVTRLRRLWPVGQLRAVAEECHENELSWSVIGSKPSTKKRSSMRARAPSPSRALGSPSLNARRIPEAFSAKPIAVSPNRAVFHYPRQDTRPSAMPRCRARRSRRSSGRHRPSDRLLPWDGH